MPVNAVAHGDWTGSGKIFPAKKQKNFRRSLSLSTFHIPCYRAGTMSFAGILALIHLIAFTQVPVHTEPTGKTLSGTDEAMIWVTSKKPRVKVETARGVSFNIDFATHSALCLTHISAELNTEPKGLTLSFAPADGMLSASYDKDAKALEIFLRNGKDPLAKLDLKPTNVTTRVLLRQREQLALFAVPPDGSHATLVWLGRVYYLVVFRNAGQYELCKDLKIMMGKREISADEFRTGIKLGALDEIADVVVTGTSPAGAPFQHRYTFDYKTVTKMVDSAYGSFMKEAGNPSTEEESADKQPPVEFTQ